VHRAHELEDAVVTPMGLGPGPGPGLGLRIFVLTAVVACSGCWLKSSNFPEEMREYQQCLRENPNRKEACDEAHAVAAAEYDRYERNAKQSFACPPDEPACQPHR
jgi:hypothetical protein